MKDKVLHTLSYSLSVLLYPLFVPTYLMVVFCVMWNTCAMPLTRAYWAVVLGGTLFFTCLVPLCTLGIMIAMGHVKNLDVSDRKERIAPFCCTLVSLGFWVWFLARVHMPDFIIWSGVATLVSLLLVMIITFWWKISIHSTSMGGALGILIGLQLFFHADSIRAIVVWLLMSWLLMCARIYLNAHTQEQTVAGYLLGLTCTLIPNLIILL